MKRLIKWILNILTLLVGLLLAGAYISRIINPVDFWPISFLGLFFPVILVCSILLLIVLVISRNKFSFLIIGLLIIGWNPIRESVQLVSKSKPMEDNPGIRIMSYNVQVFDYFRMKGMDNRGQKLLEFIAQQQPDIVCFQEFMVNRTGNFSLKNIGEVLHFAPFNHTKYIYEGGRHRVGHAIFSKYPIVNSGGDSLSAENKLYIYADIKINSDTVRVFSNHLESYHFSKEQVGLLDSLISKNPKEKKSEYLEIIKDMKAAYIERASQANQVHKEIIASPHPVIVTGDFNDTPVSYSYRTIKDDLKDAFVASGKGIGATYREFLLPLRIDYLLHSSEITSTGFTRHDVEFSDHHPIEATFRLNASERKRR